MEKTDERLKKLQALIEQSHGEFVIVVAQVDPDGVASAMGLAAILRSVRQGPCHVRIVYCGKISHPQNRAIFNKCNLGREMMPVQELQALPQKSQVIFVDSSSLTDTRVPEHLALQRPAIIIDHHRGEPLPEGEQEWYWIEDVGAASTLIVELAERTKTDLGGHLPILLALGIYTDTKSMVAAGDRDRAAYSNMMERVDAHELNQLITYSFPESHFENLAYALSHTTMVGNGRLVANAGLMKSEDGDDLSIIADLLLRRDGVMLVVVWGIFPKEQKVRVSSRCKSLSTPLDQFLKDRFGKTSAGAKLAPDGRGEGGALVTLDLGNWISEGVLEQLETLVSARINELIFSE